ncbi:MAG: ABC transporter ATP-binding protein [Candidatus Heimdallarchaeota archaeon]|nr:ABC transporter ATP-binding protein [Candidatus Heimdallarchaeota archaeon]
MAISIKNLVIERSKAINDLSIVYDTPGCLGILGPNGAGKSTLANVICGLLKRDAGEVKILDMDPEESSTLVRQQIGLVTQETALYDYLTAKENLEFHAKFYGIPKDQQNIKVEEALKLADLEDRAKDRVSTFSGGMKRRLALVRSLMHDPKILILDEPTLGIDVQSRNDIWQHIKKIKETKLVILNTNYMEEADALADTCLIIDKGKMVTLGTPDELKRKHAGGVFLEALITIDDDEYIDFKDRMTKISGGKPSVQSRDDEYRVIIPSDKPSNKLLTEFSSSLQRLDSLKILDLSLREPSLADVFLSLTGKSLVKEE